MHDCVWPWYSTTFGYGDFTFCCFSDRHSLGRIDNYDGDLNGVWNSDVIVNVRKRIVEGKVSEVCPSTCPYLISGPEQNLWGMDRRIIKNLAHIKDQEQRYRAEKNYTKAKESFFAGDVIVNHTPVWLMINCGTSCNLKCKFCYQIRKPYQVPSDRAIHYIEQCADNLTYVHLTGGEPLVTKFGRRLLSMLNENKYKFVVDLGTNGQFIDFKLLKNVLLGRIQISTDAATRKTYEHIRVNGDFDDLINNIKEFVAMSKDRPEMDITTNYTVTSDNYKEIPLAIELYESLGLECWFHLVLYEKNDPMTLIERPDLFDDFLKKIDEGISITKNKVTVEKLKIMKKTVEKKMDSNMKLDQIKM